MKVYQCTYRVKAAQWFDTDENRKLFAAWFEKHDTVFATSGPVIDLPEGTVHEGEWVLWFDLGDHFIIMDDRTFRADYTEL
jgi:hypothetical protein